LEGIQYTDRYSNLCRQHSHYIKLGVENLTGGAYDCAIETGKAVSLQAWSGPENSRKLRVPDFITTAQGWW
jgi:hypothetical protein